MKKILAIVLVLAMVLVPVSALAASTVRTITVDNDAAKGTVTIVATGTDTALTAFDTATDYTVNIATKEGWLVDTANCTGATFTEVTNGRAATADIAPGDTAVAIKVVYVEDPTAIKGAVTANGAVTDLFGTVTVDKPKARTGKVKLTANITDALFVGWSEDPTATEADAGLAKTVTIEVDAAEYNASKTYYAIANTAVGSIIAKVDPLNPYGTVSVVWTSATTATVTAKANAGAKFWSWMTDDNMKGVTIVEAQKTNPVMKLVNITTDDEVLVTAQFIKASGNINSDDATAGKSDNPKTGDSSNLALWSIMGIIALGGVALAAKKVFAK